MKGKGGITCTLTGIDEGGGVVPEPEPEPEPESWLPVLVPERRVAALVAASAWVGLLLRSVTGPV